MINMTDVAEIEHQLRVALQPLRLIVRDDGHLHIGHAGRGHFHVEIVANCFCKKGRIARHRIVYDILKNQMQSGSIHALAILALTPLEYDKTLSSYKRSS